MENDDSYVKNKKDETDEKEAEQQTASTVSSPFNPFKYSDGDIPNSSLKHCLK